MGSIGVYLDEKTASRLTRAAEVHKPPFSGGQQAAEILQRVFGQDPLGRTLRQKLELPEA